MKTNVGMNYAFVLEMAIPNFAATTARTRRIRISRRSNAIAAIQVAN